LEKEIGILDFLEKGNGIFPFLRGMTTGGDFRQKEGNPTLIPPEKSGQALLTPHPLSLSLRRGMTTRGGF